MLAMPWSAISRRNAGLVSVARYTSPIPRRAKGSIDHGRLKPSTSTRVFEDRERADALGRGCGQLEADRAADVVHDEVKAIEVERVDRGAGPAAVARPGVVEVVGPRRQAEARQVEGHAAQPPRGQLVEHLAVEERRGGHAVDAHHGVSVARLPHERRHAGGLEPAARRAVAFDDFGARHGNEIRDESAGQPAAARSARSASTASSPRPISSVSTSTMRASNCVPAQRCSSVSASPTSMPVR